MSLLVNVLIFMGLYNNYLLHSFNFLYRKEKEKYSPNTVCHDEIQVKYTVLHKMTEP